MQVDTAIKAGGFSHPGLLRGVNEDRYHFDPLRKILIVVDGMGGQAAGEHAAETALAAIRARLERETGALADRVREAITLANNDIHRQATQSPEWHGMACVLTVAVVGSGEVVIGHVGDTRLYKLRAGRIEKLTRDHSPVGEREDAGELNEREAMHHPRRNEVYRDVGSEPRQANDPNFIDVYRAPFEADAALLLCSDGLTDAVGSAAIADIVRAYAGHPAEIARALVDAANEAGGKDNVTVVYAEGPQFAMGEETRDLRAHRAAPPAPGEKPALPTPSAAVNDRPTPTTARKRPWVTLLVIALLAAVAGAAAYLQRDRLNLVLPDLSAWIPWRSDGTGIIAGPSVIRVKAGESIAAAIIRATPGSQVVVEPGEYREQIRLKTGVLVVSRIPRAASLRLPADASEVDAAVVATDVTDAGLSGFRIVGDSATPLGGGVIVRDSDITLSDVEISGAHAAAVDYGGRSTGSIFGADLHDNPGVGLMVRSGAMPRITHNTLSRNATGRGAAAALVIEASGRPAVVSNTFVGTRAESVSAAEPAVATSIVRDNWFIEPPVPVPPRPGRGGRR